MTREEHIAALEKYRDGILSGGISVPYDDLMIALDASIAALRGPQPNPDTGLMPCGCGGKAKITEQSLNWLIKCVECGIQLEVYGGRGGAVWSWNRAMGWEDKG